MKNDTAVKFTEAGQNLFDRICAIWPKIIRPQRQQKIKQMLWLLIKSRKLRIADETLVIEATRMVVPKSYDPLFDMMQDPEKFRKQLLEPFQDIQAYHRIPVRVRRWKHPRTKKIKKAIEKRRVLAVCASPRKNGNTDLLVTEALKGAAAAGVLTEKVYLQKINMKHCIGCRKCKEPGYDKVCVINDDMTELYRKIIDAHGLIIGFPIYTGRECAQLSTFLDRWDGYERYMLKSCLEPGRKAMVIGTWGYPAIDTYDHVIENVISVLNLHKVETIEALSACGFEGILHGLDEKRRGVIARYPHLLKKAGNAGQSLALALI